MKMGKRNGIRKSTFEVWKHSLSSGDDCKIDRYTDVDLTTHMPSQGICNFRLIIDMLCISINRILDPHKFIHFIFHQSILVPHFLLLGYFTVLLRHVTMHIEVFMYHDYGNTSTE